MATGGFRSDRNYLRSASKLKKFVPSLEKYTGKKKLTAQEKSAIARAEKKVREAGRLIPLTPLQAKRLKDKSALAGNGIRAVRVDNTQDGARVYVDKKGNLKIKSGGRTIQYVSADFPDGVMAAAEKVFAKNRRATVWLWLKAGRANKASRDEADFARYIMSKLQAYKETDQWILGIAYLA